MRSFLAKGVFFPCDNLAVTGAKGVFFSYQVLALFAPFS
jgi:hypothetical protein